MSDPAGPDTHFDSGVPSPSHSLTLFRSGIRTVVDLAIFGSIGFAVHAWVDHEWISWSAAIVVMALAAAVWIVFRVPGDVGLPFPVTVSVSGRVRFLIELAITAIAAYGLWTTASRAAGETLLTVVGIHYAVTWDRVRWLLTVPADSASRR